MTEYELLGPHGRDREDETTDDNFYVAPRMVAHIDDAAIAETTAIYRDLLAALSPQGRILDLMSSRYSHLPPDLSLSEVVGLGMNADELAENPQLTSYLIHDLNADPRLPFDDDSFDAVLNTVSVQYLLHPVAVFRDVARVLRPGAPYAVVFSNRMFPTKAIRAWRERTDAQHIALVRRYFEAAASYSEPEIITRPGRSSPIPWGGWGGSDPLYAVIARKNKSA